MARRMASIQNLNANLRKPEGYRVPNYTVKDQQEYHDWNKAEAVKAKDMGKTHVQKDGTTHRTNPKGMDIKGKTSGSFNEVAKKGNSATPAKAATAAPRVHKASIAASNAALKTPKVTPKASAPTKKCC